MTDIELYGGPTSKHTPVRRTLLNGGPQYVFRFENNYGASLIRSYFSYGNELAVLYFHNEDVDDYRLVYDTPITNDVLGHLDAEDVEEALDAIKALPPRTPAIEPTDTKSIEE
jgi:hypothetical protein